MENKYFNCYKCHLYNKFYISKGIKGKNCKRCHCFNYFKKKKKYHRNNFNNHRGNQFPRINNESSINNYHNEPNISYLPQIPLSTYNNFSILIQFIIIIMIQITILTLILIQIFRILAFIIIIF